MERAFVDASAWVAHADDRDPEHDAVGRALAEYEGRLVTSNFIIDEAITMASMRRPRLVKANLLAVAPSCAE